MSADSGPGNREIARRLFAAEFDDATLSYSESDEERAPNYVVTPTGARVNRLFAVGVLTEVEEVNEDSLRGRVVDPTGAFVTYAGQYQPDEHAFLSRTEPPTFVALSGKARTFEPEDSDRVFTSVRPESINEVDAETRDRWVVSAAERTLHRLAVFAAALDSDLRGDDLRDALVADGVGPSLAAGVPKAIEHYDTGTAYLEAVRSLAVEAVEQVAGERDVVRSLETEPSDGGPAEQNQSSRRKRKQSSPKNPNRLRRRQRKPKAERSPPKRLRRRLRRTRKRIRTQPKSTKRRRRGRTRRRLRNSVTSTPASRSKRPSRKRPRRSATSIPRRPSTTRKP
jgi:RPA family protein